MRVMQVQHEPGCTSSVTQQRRVLQEGMQMDDVGPRAADLPGGLLVIAAVERRRHRMGRQAGPQRRQQLAPVLDPVATHRQRDDRMTARTRPRLRRLPVGPDMQRKVDRLPQRASELGGNDPGGPADHSRGQQAVTRLADHRYPHRRAVCIAGVACPVNDTRDASCP